MAAPSAAGPVLAGLRPYSVVASVCRTRGLLSVALSDPYLSCSRPLCTAPLDTELHALQEALRHEPVGAILVAAPMQRHRRWPRAVAAFQRSLDARIARSGALGGRC